MQDHIFRSYDIRGIVGEDLMIEEIPALINALSKYLTETYPNIRVIVLGRDGRIDSPSIHRSVCEALRANGFDILDIGLCTTPIVQFTASVLQIDASIMITASHNGPAWNGFKITACGFPVQGEDLQQLLSLFKRGAKISKPQLLGRCFDYTEMTERYCDWLAEHFSSIKMKDPKIVFDCGNGATGKVMPTLLEKLGWKHSRLLYEEVDGRYPNHIADPTVFENMRSLANVVKAEGFNYGIGFDGDGDRMGLISSESKLVASDKLLILYSESILQNEIGAAIIYDIRCSKNVSDFVKRNGGFAYPSKAGSSNIRSSMQLNKALLAGELSGHFFFRDRHFGFDDGIYAALRLIEQLDKNNGSIEESLKKLPKSYATTEWRLFCEEADKLRVMNEVIRYLENSDQVNSICKIDGALANLENGWCMIRASNTQPALSLRCEGFTIEGLNESAQLLHNALKMASNNSLSGLESFKAWINSALN